MGVRRFLSVLVLVALAFVAHASEPVWTEASDDGARVHLYFFWSKKCPHCLAARPRVAELAERNPWILLHDHEVSESRANVARFVDMAEQSGQKARAVPTLFYCGRMEVGLGSDEASLAALLARLESCRREGADRGRPAQESAPTLAVPFVGDVDVSGYSLPLLTVLIAGLDAFNPCAFFVLLFLLSLMVHQRSRRRMALVGGVFVAFSGLIYFVFMAAWLNAFLLAGSLPWVTGAAGLLALAMGAVNVKDCVRPRQGPSLSIPDAGREGIIQRVRGLVAADRLAPMLGATVFLAVSSNLYELLCTAGFPMVFTRVLTLQESSAVRHYLYLALYNVVYVLPLLAIVLGFVHTLGARKLTEREGRLLKLLSGLMMCGLGALLLAAPDALANPLTALGIPCAALAATWLAARRMRR